MPSICTRRLPRRKRRNRTSESSAGCIAQRATYSPTRCPRSLQPLDQGVRSLSQLRKSNDTQDVRGTYSRAVGNSSDHPAELRARPGFHIFDLPPSLLLSAAGEYNDVEAWPAERNESSRFGQIGTSRVKSQKLLPQHVYNRCHGH